MSSDVMEIFSYEVGSNVRKTGSYNLQVDEQFVPDLYANDPIMMIRANQIQDTIE